ncbi:MAG: hypothetical protein ACK52L_03980, partial [Pirellula sp.]
FPSQKTTDHHSISLTLGDQHLSPPTCPHGRLAGHKNLRPHARVGATPTFGISNSLFRVWLRSGAEGR